MIAAPLVRSARFAFPYPNLAGYPRSLRSAIILPNHALHRIRNGSEILKHAGELSDSLLFRSGDPLEGELNFDPAWLGMKLSARDRTIGSRFAPPTKRLRGQG